MLRRPIKYTNNSELWGGEFADRQTDTHTHTHKFSRSTEGVVWEGNSYYLGNGCR
jgi:hypothetical protein